MNEQIADLIRTGHYEQATAHASESLDTVGESTDLQEQLDALNSVRAAARELIQTGHTDAGFGLIGEIRSRLTSVQHWKIHLYIAAAITMEGEARSRLGQPVEAIACYDEALALMSVSDEFAQRGTVTPVLLAKGRVLGSLDRREEALVVFDGAVSTIRSAPRSKATIRTPRAVEAFVWKLELLVQLDRYDELRLLCAEFSDLLQGMRGTRPPDIAPEPTESSLAAALAEIFDDGECWPVFEHPEEPIAHDVAAERALRFYRAAAPWGISTDGNVTAVDVAAAMVRGIADAYALLAGDWSAAERSTLALPGRADRDRDRLLRAHGVDDWAAEHGSPLTLTGDATDKETSAETPSLPEGHDPDGVGGSVIRTVARLMYLYELLGTLSETVEGRAALRSNAAVRWRAIQDLHWARNQIRLAAAAGVADERGGVLFACLLIAQGVFVASHETGDSASALFPPVGTLRGFLHGVGGYDWLANRDVPLPSWTKSPD